MSTIECWILPLVGGTFLVSPSHEKVSTEGKQKGLFRRCLCARAREMRVVMLARSQTKRNFCLFLVVTQAIFWFTFNTCDAASLSTERFTSNFLSVGRNATRRPTYSYSFFMGDPENASLKKRYACTYVDRRTHAHGEREREKIITLDDGGRGNQR